MRRWVVVGVIVTALVAVALYAFFIRERGNYFASAVTDAPQEATITLTDSGFVPRETTIRQGGTITFTNDTAKPFWPASNLHPSHQLYSEFDPLRPLSVDETWSFTFERLGTHNFHDHLRSYFVGKIHVVE